MKKSFLLSMVATIILVNVYATESIFAYTADGGSISNVVSPLKQFKSGIAANNVTCNEGFQLVIKAEDGSPACVNPNTAQILMERGWTKGIITQTSQNSTLPASFKQCDTTFPQPNTGIQVLYMPVNSIGKICVHYSSPNHEINATLTVFNATSDKQTKDIIISTQPKIIPIGNSTIAYMIKTGNQTGFYGFTIFCSGIPFAVGYNNQSNIAMNDFPWAKPHLASCPPIDYQYKIIGLSNIGVVYISSQ